MNMSKDFKKGPNEYERVVARNKKLESEVELYKKVLAKAERDSKKVED